MCRAFQRYLQLVSFVGYVIVKELILISHWSDHVSALALWCLFIKVVCKNGSKVLTLKNVNCVNMNSTWRPRLNRLERYGTTAHCFLYILIAIRSSLMDSFQHGQFCTVTYMYSTLRVYYFIYLYCIAEVWEYCMWCLQ